METIINLWIYIKGIFDTYKPKPKPDYDEIERGLGIKKDPKA